MKHYGDITKLNGYDLPIVDIITGGSPCQDLSIAGKRAGLAGERSGLFMEQIRIIKEMRDESARQLSMRGADVDIRFIQPRFMVWENVPGAFSSNKGEDFRCVLEEVCRVADKTATVPMPEKGKWSTSGCIMGDSWSVAWRVHDAQFWGVPQRRKRIALVADFGGTTAPEILFERKSVSGDITESRKEGEGAAADVERGVGETGGAISFQERAGKPGGGKGILIQNERTGALSTLNNQSVCVGFDGYNQSPTGDVAISRVGSHIYTDGVTGSLRANAGDNQQAIVYGISSDGSNAMRSDNPHSGIYEAETARTLDLNGGSPACNQGGMAIVQSAGVDTYNQTIDEELAQPLRAADGGDSTPKVVCIENHPADSRVKIAEDGIVRRLTPLECERLQGYPVVRKVRFSEMTKDEYIAWNINEGNIIVDTEYGKVFATRGPGGVKLDEPKELTGSIVNGYRVVSIRNGETKMQCRVNRVVWIAEHGIIPDGYVIDHINNDKQDNRRCNLQLLTAAENSTKAREDGLYKIHGDSGSAKITDDVHDFIQYVYGNTDLSIRQLSEIFGISKSRIQQIIHDEPWTDIGDWIDSKGKKHKGDSDSPRYKALGNSIALPFWQWMAQRMVKQLKIDGTDSPTMASLFDGIGGFPLVFSRAGAIPVWASEIEEFPIAVTKIHFPEEDTE